MTKLFKKDSLLNVSVKNSSQAIARVLIGILNIKITAVLLGPSGLPLVNQMQNFLQLTANLANGGTYNGIIKILSESSLKQYKNEVINTGYLIVVFASVSISLVCIIFSREISLFLFGSATYKHIILCSFIYIIPFALFNLLLSITNGIQQLKIYLTITITYLVSGFVSYALAIYYWGLTGALWAILLQGIIGMIIYRKSITKLKLRPKLLYNKIVIRRLSKYSLMAIVSNAIAPLAVIIIRRIIINNLSLHEAGIWDGVYKISNSYINLSLISFSYYFLPTFSKKISAIEIRTELKDSLKVLIPILLLSSGLIYVFRDLIIKLLLTESFEAVSYIIKWQIIGDVLAVLCWLIRILLIAKEKMRAYIYSEITSGILLISISYTAIRLIGIEGSTISYCITNLVNLLILYFIYSHYWRRY
jgi:PST family polysaccharide transporter